MKEFFENAPKIIAEAAKSPLGICALLILTIALLAWLFFGNSSEEIKAAVFILIVVSFLFLSVASFRYMSSEKPQNKTPNSSEPVLEAPNKKPVNIEQRRFVEWTHFANPGEKYVLSSAEVDVLEALKGKPDVYWTRELLLNTAGRKSAHDNDELIAALNNLTKNGYLFLDKENRYQVMPLAVDYYRSIDTRQVHEIDEADYWDGNL